MLRISTSPSLTRSTRAECSVMGFPPTPMARMVPAKGTPARRANSGTRPIVAAPVSTTNGTGSRPFTETSIKSSGSVCRKGSRLVAGPWISYGVRPWKLSRSCAGKGSCAREPSLR
jgi:hypothetical protein